MRKTTALVRNYYILLCCLLLLNLSNSLISYKAELVADPFARTALVILVLCGASTVTLVLAPAMGFAVKFMRQTSRRRGGRVGEILFLIILGAGVMVLLPAL